MSRTTQHDPHLKWEIAPGWEHLLLHSDGPPLAQRIEQGQGEVVKQGANRTVFRIDLAQRTLFVKHYRAARGLSVWRQLAQACHSRREWRKALEVARRHIPTAPPVAVVEQQRGWFVRDNYYVCEGIPDSQTIDAFVRDTLRRLPASAQASCKRRLLVALARFVAAAHAAGIEHNDLHTGNILLRWPAQADHLQLYLIDLPGIRLRGPLNWPRSRANLAMLGGGWLQRLSRGDRLRFWRSYVAQRGDIAATIPPQAAQELFAAVRVHARRVAGRRDKRSLRSNRDFQRVQSDRGLVHAIRELPLETLQRLSTDPARLLRDHRHQPVKLGHGSLLVEARLAAGKAAMAVAYKRSRAKTWWKRLVGMFRRSRAIAAWHTGHALLARGIDTARPLAAIRTSRLSGESYLATAWIENALNLHLYGWELATYDPRVRHQRACRAAESLGRLIGRMHAWCISHRDLKGCNLVIAERADQASAYLIDLDSVRFLRRMSTIQQARDLSRLAASMEAHPWLSNTVRVRFLRAYLRETHGNRKDWKILWQEVARRTHSILSRFQEQGRPVA